MASRWLFSCARSARAASCRRGTAVLKRSAMASRSSEGAAFTVGATGGGALLAFGIGLFALSLLQARVPDVSNALVVSVLEPTHAGPTRTERIVLSTGSSFSLSTSAGGSPLTGSTLLLDGASCGQRSPHRCAEDHARATTWGCRRPALLAPCLQPAHSARHTPRLQCNGTRIMASASKITKMQAHLVCQISTNSASQKAP
jgi:hypothetical protein